MHTARFSRLAAAIAARAASSEARRIELRVQIVDEYARGLRPCAGGGPGGRQAGNLQELAAVDHVASFVFRVD